MMIACLGEHLPGSCAELVFNLDQAGIFEWEDRAPREVIVPVSRTDQKIHHGVRRNPKHVSDMLFISGWRVLDAIRSLLTG
jgi:hypothetical protein